MRFEDFRSGELRQRHQYQSFTPTTINREWTWSDPRINVLLEKAVCKVGQS